MQKILIEIEKLNLLHQQEKQQQQTNTNNLITSNQIADYSDLVKKLFKGIHLILERELETISLWFKNKIKYHIFYR